MTNAIDKSAISDTHFITPSSSSNDGRNNIAAAAYYNCAFDIVGKGNPNASRPTSASDARLRREAARMQYQRILWQRSKSTRSFEKGQDGITQSKICPETDSVKGYNVPVEVHPLNDTGLLTNEHEHPCDPCGVVKLLRMEEIAVDEDGANFETIIGGKVDDNYDDRDPPSVGVETNITSTTTDDDSFPSITNLPSFAQEHSIFAQAILQLLTERDQHSTESSCDNDTHTIVKSGMLKKISHRMIGVWKNKFVELRAGSLSYYEYSGDDDYYTQVKSIPLRAPLCKCRVIEPPKFAIGGAYVFELVVGSGPKRFWMANSAVERNSWVNAIKSASSHENEKVSDETPASDNEGIHRWPGKKFKPKPKVPTQPPVHYDDREVYLQVQRMCKKASSKAQYLQAISRIDGKTLNVPVHWVEENIAATSNDSTDGAFKEEAIDINVEQFWKDMMRDTVSINDQVFSGDLLHGPEKIVGRLTRSILDFDRIATKEEAKMTKADANHTNRFCIKESEAVFYARDLLLSSNRTKSGGHSYYCASALCNNPSLVVIVPNSSTAEPLRLTLRHTAPAVENGDKIRKNEESLLSEQLKINIVPSSPQCEKIKDQTNFVFPRVLPILKHLRIPHSLTDHLNPNKNNSESMDGTTDEASNFRTFSPTGEEKIENRKDEDRSTVEVLVHVSSEYKICTTDPSGDAFDDTWCLVKALFLQNFYIGGGPNGGIQIGDAQIQFCISSC